MNSPSSLGELRGQQKAGKEEVPGWLSQLSVGLLVSARVMVSWFVSSSPTLGSMLTVWSLLGTLSFPLSLCSSPSVGLPIKIN